MPVSECGWSDVASARMFPKNTWRACYHEHDLPLGLPALIKVGSVPVPLRVPRSSHVSVKVSPPLTLPQVQQDHQTSFSKIASPLLRYARQCLDHRLTPDPGSREQSLDTKYKSFYHPAHRCASSVPASIDIMIVFHDEYARHTTVICTAFH
jgi:hypothetical protein